jgi:alkyl hydroperoxide reductase subunit AhpC
VQMKRYYECAGTHLYGYSASDNYWNENWQRWISYTRTPGFPFGVDEKNKIIRK